MANFCSKCGKQLNDGERCNCQPETNFLSTCKSFFKKLIKRMGILEGLDQPNDLFELNKSIVPDVVQANESEIPIKQYEVATLRSRIRGQFTKGRLQVTNKRILFRAAGASLQGRIVNQHEFDINEISGIDVKVSNRVSPLNIILGILSAIIICPIFSDMFTNLLMESPDTAIFLSILLALASALPFFLIKKRFWLKFLSLTCGLGCLLGTGGLANMSSYSILFCIETNVADFVGIVFAVLWLISLVFVSLVPDLTLCIKTKGAAEAINIRRKQNASMFKQEIEYTGFSEVVPGKDVAKMTAELGTLIDDLHTLGDMAIEKWKED